MGTVGFNRLLAPTAQAAANSGAPRQHHDAKRADLHNITTAASHQRSLVVLVVAHEAVASLVGGWEAWVVGCGHHLVGCEGE